MSAQDHLNEDQFDVPRLYHGTNASLSPGDHIEPGYQPQGRNFPGVEYGDDEAGNVYATPHRAKAHWYAVNAVKEQGEGEPHTYIVHPAGSGAAFDTETNPDDFESDEAMARHGSRMASSFTVEREVSPVYKEPGGHRPLPPIPSYGDEKPNGRGWLKNRWA